ncbi:MAG: hypothetical protein QM760_11765 [Nibricoccus sp.]
MSIARLVTGRLIFVQPAIVAGKGLGEAGAFENKFSINWKTSLSAGCAGAGVESAAR